MRAYSRKVAPADSVRSTWKPSTTSVMCPAVRTIFRSTCAAQEGELGLGLG